MKKIISGLLMLCMAVQMTFTVSAQTKYALADYSSGTGVYDNLSLKSASDYTMVDMGDSYALCLKTSSVLGTNNLRFSINSAMTDTMFEDCLKVTVTYYDKGNGRFSLNYSKRDGTNFASDPIIMNNTGDILDAVYYLYDFKTDSNFLNIGLYAENMNQSKEDVYIKSIKAEKTGYTFPVNLTENYVTTGNQFFTGDTPQISLTGQNISSARLPLSYKVVITDFYGATSVSQTGSVSFSKGYSTKTIPLGNVDYGVYDAVIQFTGTNDSSIYGEFKTNFSMSVKAEQSEDFCINTHTVGYTDRDPSKSIPLVAKMGCNMIRESLRWDTVEKSKGVYAIPESFDRTYAQASANGVGMLVVLSGNNSLYIDDVYKDYDYLTGEYYFPQGDAAIKAFGDYVEFVVGSLKGKVNAFQIWNEFQGTCYNRVTQVYKYMDLLEEAYKRAKKANPDCILVGGSGFESVLSWADEYFILGGANMSDAISFHLYPGDWKSRADSLVTSNMKSIYNLMKNNYSWEKFPVWITETGWNTAIGYVPENQQFSNAIRGYIQGKELGFDKYFYYDFKNDRTNRTEIQGNFGTVYMHIEKVKVPYSAKPSYVALTNMNSLIAKAEITDHVIKEDGTNIYTFMREDGKRVWVLWQITELELPTDVNIDKESLVLVDAFGNRETVTGNNGVYEVYVSEVPVYLVEE